MTRYKYALIDGVMRQNAIKELYTAKEPVQVIPLYTGTRFQANQDLGPILVATPVSSNLITTLQNTWYESTTLLQSNHSLSEVATHLSQFITVTDDTGSDALFRFADPLITWYWLNSYPENLLPNIMGPISVWHIPRPQYDWQTDERQWDIYTNPNTERQQLKINHLAEPQTNALNQAADFRFKNKQYQLLMQRCNHPFQNKTEAQITEWFNQVIAEAETNYLTTQRTFAIWVDLSANYGQDFLNQPNGEYQTWLAHNQESNPLPLDMKLERFYRHLYNI